MIPGARPSQDAGQDHALAHLLRHYWPDWAILGLKNNERPQNDTFGKQSQPLRLVMVMLLLKIVIVTLF